MKKLFRKIPYTAAVLFLLLANSGTAFSQMVSPLTYQGGPETHLYRYSTVMIENTILDEGGGIEPAGSLTLGLSQLHSQFVKIFYVPVRYSITDNIECSLSLPFISNSLMYQDRFYTKTGLGDLKLGLSWFIEPTSGLSFTTGAKVTIPTGNSSSKSKDFVVATGHGSYTASVLQSAALSLGGNPPAFKIFMNGGIVYYGKTDRDHDTLARYNIDASFLFSAMAGVEYAVFDRLFVQAKASFTVNPEGSYQSITRTSDTGVWTTSAWTDMNDALTTLDVIGVARYTILKRTNFRMMFIYPVYEWQDDDLAKEQKRRWKLFFNLERSF
ncbi:MAG: hypothetical protein GY754_26835 [bacterium]|nr:hypothetical protein [bacterium]